MESNNTNNNEMEIYSKTYYLRTKIVKIKE